MTTERDREERFRQYPRTVLSFEGGPRIDLRRPLSAADRRALAALELGPTFTVLTAENPGGDEGGSLSPDELADRQRQNTRRILRLEEHLAREPIPFRRVAASVPGGGHVEHCVAVAGSRDEATRLAAARDQVALFWYDGERFWLWPARVAQTPRPLPAP